MTTPTSGSSLRLAHVADVHMGASYVHGDEDKGGVNSRLVDFREAWVRSCRQMVEDAVGLVLFAGDGFRDAKPTPTEQAALRQGIEELAGAEIPIVMITGNHDQPRQVGRTHALEIFDEYSSVTIVDGPGVPQRGWPSLAIACFPYPNRAHIAAQDPEFEKLGLDEQNARMVELSLTTLRGLAAEAEKSAGPFGSVLLGHAAISGSAIGAEQGTLFLREPVLPLSELRGLPFRYQAWGHLHKAQELEKHIRYSGSVERTDFAEAQEDKGWWLVELNEDPSKDFVQWRSSNPRPFLDMEVEDPSEWGKSLPDRLYGTGATEGAIVRVTYTATPEEARTVDHAAIRRALLSAGAAKVHGPFAKIERTVTAQSAEVTEETDVLTGWMEWADLQGLGGPQRERLDRKVGESLEVTHA